jgi:hypothetical protein
MSPKAKLLLMFSLSQPKNLTEKKKKQSKTLTKIGLYQGGKWPQGKYQRNKTL